MAIWLDVYVVQESYGYTLYFRDSRGPQSLPIEDCGGRIEAQGRALTIVEKNTGQPWTCSLWVETNENAFSHLFPMPT